MPNPHKRLEKLLPYGLTNTNKNINLIKSRLGSTNITPPQIDTIDGSLNMAKRLISNGGFAQQQRMIKDKKHSLDQATKYSYQGAFVRKCVESNDNEEKNYLPLTRALINPNKLKQDYDEKIISIDFNYGCAPGDVIEWVGTQTYWLIYLQELTELAYFRANMRKCSYEISYKLDGELKRTFAAVRGPVETRIETIQKISTGFDLPNFSLMILLPKTIDNLKYFVRYAKFYLSDGYKNICWRIEGVDSFSTPGIIQINAVEYYGNKDKDDIEHGIVNNENENIANMSLLTISNDSGVTIVGEDQVIPHISSDYYYNGQNQIGYKWFVKEHNLPVEIKKYKDKHGVPHITITWQEHYSGQFELCYGTFEDYVSKVISVKSLF